MPKIQTSKKFWLTLALVGTGFFIFIFTILQSEPPQNHKNGNGGEDVLKPVSSIYLPGLKAADKNGTWQNSDFKRYIYDISPEGYLLDKCYYFLYDNIKGEKTRGGERECNDNLIIGVGEGRSCPSQGEYACTLYVYARDVNGNQGEMATIVYHIDWQDPEVGKVYTKENETYPIEIKKGSTQNFQAEVSDSVELFYCWLYLNGKNIGKMNIDPVVCKEGNKCIASLSYTVTGELIKTAATRCADRYSPEKEGYLNAFSGDAVEIKVYTNHAPEIVSCRVNPVKGNTETVFNFKVEAIDPDGDELFYQWDFGDGNFSSEESPSHSYDSPADYYYPKVVVYDDKGSEAKCVTAWATVVAPE